MLGSIDGFCACGSGKSADACCLPIMQGIQQAQTAEQLMRSRYTAYVMENSEYLLHSWHSSTRPQTLSLKPGEVNWVGLTVGKIQAGQPGDRKGEVEFVASYEQAGQNRQVQENSCFIFEQNQWFYLQESIGSAGKKTGRNAPCPCGSGKKFKKCCASKS